MRYSSGSSGDLDGSTTSRRTSLRDLARAILCFAAGRAQTPARTPRPFALPAADPCSSPRLCDTQQKRGSSSGRAASTTEINLHIDSEAHESELTHPSSPVSERRPLGSCSLPAAGIPAPRVTFLLQPCTSHMHSSCVHTDYFPITISGTLR